MGIFKDVLSNYLEMFLGFGISVTLTPGTYAATLMEFDSSDEKFSRHVVVIFPNNLVFRNTDDVCLRRNFTGVFSGKRFRIKEKSIISCHSVLLGT